ncbi:metallophosphoesterase family protein [Planctomicrobium piriforme]|uniref:Serine/threonine protein phosphatase 1 n=1 Tax=Planctomicrobium piriforme TaxID=1576369 RepID=A0A1I3L742_9PLAN|nr:metallophosphoesterase family protein [Planctomicrobium piriforme]SFI80531.1 serine/threonine protein phosphatase 1 [Planctomicrobium piriforme]
MRLFAIGDLHGCYTALQTLIETVPITPQDLIITLGDYVDRGPDSRHVVQWIMDRSARAECIPLRGNHEIMLLDALKGRIPMQHWLQFGGDTVLKSYAPPGRAGMPEDIPVQHLRFLDRELLPFYETKTHIFAHACPDDQVSMRQQTDDALYWARFDNIQPHVSGKTVICGHTAQKSGVPLNRGFAVCIDTWVYGKGWLTCLEPATGQYWQANQQGESRSGELEEPVT